MSEPNIRITTARNERFARALLATTCLTVASGTGAQAALVITEGTSPAPSDFSNTSPGTLLPLGTTQVNGFASATDTDWFEFQGLLPGSPFTITSTLNQGESGLRSSIRNTSAIQLGSIDIGECCGPYTFTGTVPSDGIVLTQVFAAFGSNRGYQMNLVGTTATPEPGTTSSMLGGLALAGALAWRRRRAN